MMRRYLGVIVALCTLLIAGSGYAGRDGTGAYTAPANSFNPAITGEPIDPTDWNAILDDLESALSESVYTDDTSATDNCVIRNDGTNGLKVQSSGVCIDDSDGVTGVAGIVYTNGAAIKTGTTAADTVLFQAYDNDSGPAYVTFGTLTAGNSPSFELDNTTLDTAIAKGTWTASGTWTIPAVTLGGTVSSNGQSFSGTIADLGTVTTADINGGTIDGATIGGTSPGAITGTSVTATGDVTSGDDILLSDSGVINWNSGDCTLTEGTDTLTIAGTCVLVTEDAGLQIGQSVPFSDSTGTLTLQNIDAVDSTTESTIEGAIDTLANLTSVQSLTVTLADAGANAILGWDDAASAYENLSAAEATAILSAYVGDSGAGGTKGLVPAPGAGDSGKFLKGDGTWTTIPGGGDMLAANNLSDVVSASTAFANISTPPTVQVFTSSGTYTKPSGPAPKWLKVTVVGGGGGGGGAASTGASQSSVGGGGGGGGIGIEYIAAASVGATETVTIGAAGAGGSAGANAGSAGGTTSFGTIVTASGGDGGGSVGASGTTLITGGGAGGVGASSAQSLNLPGNAGLPGFRLNPAGGAGNGGSSGLSGGGVAGTNADGGTASGYGGGGGGGGNNQSQGSDRAGGAGAAGIVIVEEFY